MVGRFGRGLRSNPRVAAWRQRALGAFFVGLGVRLAFQQRA
jgi:threonine/homoserine/homoserine lactone efflux protein